MRKMFLLPLVLLGGLAFASEAKAQVSFGFSYGNPYGRMPPPPYGYVYGPQGRCPGPGYVWRDGYYNWNADRYYWQPGGWVRAPRPTAYWVAPGWYKHRGRNHWRQGYWR